MLRVFHPQHKTCLATKKCAASCKRVLQKVEARPTFCNKLFKRCAFYHSKQTYFATSFTFRRSWLVESVGHVKGASKVIQGAKANKMTEEDVEQEAFRLFLLF